jgi:hypothetical protein
VSEALRRWRRVQQLGYYVPFTGESPASNLEVAMAKGQMRSNKEKKKPKQDKNKKKGGAPTPSPFAGMHSQSNPGTNPYGNKKS